MLCRTPLLRIAIFVAFFHVFFIDEAHAYLDPGTGSLIFQALVATLIGSTVVARRYWSQIKSFLGRGDGDPRTTETEEGEAGNSAGGRG